MLYKGTGMSDCGLVVTTIEDDVYRIAQIDGWERYYKKVQL